MVAAPFFADGRLEVLLRTWLVLLAFLLGGPSEAEQWPAYDDVFVNDQAGLLPPTVESVVRHHLQTLKLETGIEMTVLTLPSQAAFASGMSMEEFATGIFNRWGIGDRARNDGILVLVLHRDQAMRIELGKGYGHDWDEVAGQVIERSFLPAFRSQDFVGGIMTGVPDVINAIARPFAAGQPPPARDRIRLWVQYGLAGAVLAFMAGLSMIKPIWARFRRCGNCNRTGLVESRETILAASHYGKGEGRKMLTCPHCGHVSTSLYTISMLGDASSDSTGGSGSGFGGGSSDGGGASGRW